MLGLLASGCGLTSSGTASTGPGADAGAGRGDAAAAADDADGRPFDAGGVAPAAPDAGADPGTDAGAPDPLRVIADSTGIQALEWRGTNLFEGVGGYYVIGSCTGADDANNVTTQGSDGHTMRSPGACAGAPFRMTITGTHPIVVSIEVGPLPVDYRSLSVPLDPTKAYFATFAFDGTSYEVGCALSWSGRSGASARFDSIPTPCVIPGVGGVGVARVRPPPSWGEISGPVARIRRVFRSGDGQELAFINHPGTNNIELGFNADFSRVLAAGTVVRLEEEIWVEAPPSVATVLLPLLTRALVWREPAPGEEAALGPRIDEHGREGMKSVARDLLATPEHAAARAAHTGGEMLDQLYLGLLSRDADPSGRDTYLPSIEAGDYAPVVDAIIDSGEFRALHPEARCRRRRARLAGEPRFDTRAGRVIAAAR